MRPALRDHWQLVRLTGRAALLCSLATLSLLLAGGSDVRAEELRKSGSIRIQQKQIAFIGSANLGGGTLSFNGRTYRFKIGGLGIGGFGVSRITATGNVYNLRSLGDFPGAYVQGRYGAVIGDVSTGKLWLRNSDGVVIELRAEREGLALSLGGDAIYIDLK